MAQRAGWGLIQGQTNCRDHIFKVAQNVGSGEAQGAVSLPRQNRIAVGVMARLGGLAMLEAVNLDGKAASVADKIKEIVLERDLAAEMKPIAAQATKGDPKPGFRRRERTAHGTRTGDGRVWAH